MTNADQIRTDAVELIESATKLLAIVVEAAKDGAIDASELPAVLIHADAVHVRASRLVEHSTEDAVAQAFAKRRHFSAVRAAS